METAPHWKRIWRGITGTSVVATPNVAEEALKLAKDHLLQGITMFPSYTEESFIKCSEKIELIDHPALSKFVLKLSITLDLDACMTWSIFCNYLMFEYYGKVEYMDAIIKDKTSEKMFMVNVWQFYTLERAYLLRILQYIIENYKNTSHKYHDLYTKFIDETTFKKLRESLFNQFSHLMKEVSYEKDPTVIKMSDLVERNNSEVLQTLLMILSTIKYEKFDVTEFMKLFALLNEHMFSLTAPQQPFFKLSPFPLFRTIQSAELALFVASMENFWFNPDAWYASIDDIEKMVKETLTSERNETILLAWATLQSTLPGDLSVIIYEQHSHVYVSKALENYVFADIFKTISNTIFKDSLPGTVAKAAFCKLFDVVCTQFDAKRVYVHQGTIPLFKLFLSTSELVSSLNTMPGIVEFLQNAISLFPFHFESLTHFMGALISSDNPTYDVPKDLCNLHTYTQVYNPPERYRSHIRNETLVRLYKPIDNDLIVFPPGSKAVIMKKYGETLVEFYGNWSYFVLLRHIVNNFLDEVEITHVYSELVQHVVLSGYKLILEILKHDPTFAWENPDVKKLLHLALCLLSLSTKVQTKNLELMRTCFEITIHIFKHDPADIVRALVAIEFLPKLSNELLCPMDFQKTYLLSNPKLFNFIEEEFSDSKSCHLLQLYIQLVNEAKKMNIYYTKLQIPACMYLFIKVFPVFARDLFSDNLKIRQIPVDLVMLIHNILKIEENSEEETDSKLYKCVMELFLHNEICAKSLMRTFECGNKKLQLMLCSEMNWQHGPFLPIVDTIEKSLECVLLLLNYMHLHGEKKYQLFENLLFEFPRSSFSVLKSVSSYVTHCFNPNIRILACKILTAFVKVSDQPLLYSLQLDDYQLQSLFVENLRDSLENQEMKVAVVELITACVREQNSMIAGFFNTTLSKGKHPDVSILSILGEYLQNIEKNPHTLLIPIQAAILDLFHELWKNNKQHLLINITDPQSFWVSLTTPLLKPANVPMELLLQILEIVILELHFSKANIQDKFDTELRGIFESPKRFLNTWMNRLIEISHDDTMLSDLSNVPLCIAMLTIWRNFILTVKLLNPEYYESKWNRSFFVQNCLQGLLHYTEVPEKSEIWTLWAELMLLFINFPIMENDDVKESIFSSITQILKNFADNYEIVNEKCRTTMLTVITIVITNFTEFLVINPTFIVPFLTPLERIFYVEYRVTFIHKYQVEDHYKNWILILRIIRTILTIDTVSDIEYFFIHIRFVERLSEVLGLCLTHSFPAKLAQVTVMTLVEFAESPWVRHFETLNRRVRCYQLLPPKTVILQSNRMPTGVIPEHLKDWWIVYTHIMRLNCTLLRRRGGYVLEYIWDFVDGHRAVLADALLTATVLADATNLDLVVEVLRFIHAILQHRQKWTSSGKESFFLIMGTIKQVLNASIGIILRPQCVVFVPTIPRSAKKRAETCIPHEYLLNVIHSYLDIITLCCKCFTRCNPPLSSLLNLYKPFDYIVFVMYDFRVPTAIEDNRNLLTYGSLLCGLHYVTMALNQILYQEKERSSESTPRLNLGESSSRESTPRICTSDRSSAMSLGSDSAVLWQSDRDKVYTVHIPKVDSLTSMSISTASAFPSVSTLTTISSSTLAPPEVTKLINEEYSVIIFPQFAQESQATLDVLQGFIIPDVKGMEATWLANLNADTLMLTLNALISFLAGQIFATVRDDTIERTLHRYVKRELCSELALYYDFVIKHLCDKYVSTDDEQSGMGSDIRIMATPRRTHSKARIRSRDKTSPRVSSDTKLVVDILAVCTDRPSGRKIEMVDLEDCFLLSMVHWFRHVCSLVHYSKFDEFLSKWHAKSTYVMPHKTFVKNTSVQLSDEEEDDKGLWRRESKKPPE